MNSKKLTFILAIALLFSFASPAFAVTTASLSPTTVNVEAGDTFTVNVSVDPQGLANYTFKLELSYPANLVEVTNFSFGTGWSPLSQPGYDSVDNVSGTLVKTAGYPGGVSAARSFGTVAFRAKTSGTGSLTVGSGTSAYDAGSNNVFTGGGQVSLNVTQPSVVTPPAEESAPSTGNGSLPAASVESVAGEVQNDDEETTLTEDTQEVASTTANGLSRESLVAQVITLGTGNTVVGFIVVLVLLGILGYVGYWYYKKSTNTPEPPSMSQPLG